MTSAARLIEGVERAFGKDHRLSKIGVAVSGGSDSVALLHLLRLWGQADLSVATVDHGLRKEAADEAASVADMCAELALPHTVLHWRGWDGKGNLQGFARQNRYELLAEWAQEERCDTVVLGHTMDDQAETFLMRLARSSGVDGLSGMDQRIWRNGQRFDRPLLNIRRSELRSFLEARNIHWIEDPSNEDERFDRVKARSALASLEKMGLSTEAISQSMGNLSLAGAELRALAKDKAEEICKETFGDLVFDRTALLQTGAETKFRLLSKSLMFVSSERYPPRREAIWDLEAALVAGKNHSLHGCLILVSEMTVRITRELNAIENVVADTDQTWDGRWCFDGPHAKNMEIRALGEALQGVPNWRDAGVPRFSLLSSPAIWKDGDLISAPIAGYANGWTASATGRGTFAQFLLSR